MRLYTLSFIIFPISTCKLRDLKLCLAPEAYTTLSNASTNFCIHFFHFYYIKFLSRDRFCKNN